MSIRLQGLLTIGVAALIESAYVGPSINAAKNGTGELVVWKSFMFRPFAFMGLRLFFLAFDESSKRLLEWEGDNLSPAQLAVLVDPLAFSAITYGFVMNHLGSLGYS